MFDQSIVQGCCEECGEVLLGDELVVAFYNINLKQAEELKRAKRTVVRMASRYVEEGEI